MQCTRMYMHLHEMHVHVVHDDVVQNQKIYHNKFFCDALLQRIFLSKCFLLKSRIKYHFGLHVMKIVNVHNTYEVNYMAWHAMHLHEMHTRSALYVRVVMHLHEVHCMRVCNALT